MGSKLKMIGLTIVKILAALIVPAIILLYVMWANESRSDLDPYQIPNYREDNSIERSSNSIP